MSERQESGNEDEPLAGIGRIVCASFMRFAKTRSSEVTA